MHNIIFHYFHHGFLQQFGWAILQCSLQTFVILIDL